jgi:hypothetical protein
MGLWNGYLCGDGIENHEKLQNREKKSQVGN